MASSTCLLWQVRAPPGRIGCGARHSDVTAMEPPPIMGAAPSYYGTHRLPTTVSPRHHLPSMVRIAVRLPGRGDEAQVELPRRAHTQRGEVSREVKRRRVLSGGDYGRMVADGRLRGGYALITRGLGGGYARLQGGRRAIPHPNHSPNPNLDRNRNLTLTLTLTPAHLREHDPSHAFPRPALCDSTPKP